MAKDRGDQSSRQQEHAGGREPGERFDRDDSDRAGSLRDREASCPTEGLHACSGPATEWVIDRIRYTMSAWVHGLREGASRQRERRLAVNQFVAQPDGALLILAPDRSY